MVDHDARFVKTEINRFAFLIHPLDVGYIYRHPKFGWARVLPDKLVEWIATRVPPIYLSRIRGGRSPINGQVIEGYLYTLGSTPRQLLKRDPRIIYRQINQAARLAKQRGAGIMGLGAYTSVIGDAGITIAQQADIAITTGNSLTVAVTMETVKQAMSRMGVPDFCNTKVMVIGATGSIGSACARRLASFSCDLVLVSPEESKLLDLKFRIEDEKLGARVGIATQTNDQIGQCDLIISATSARGQNVLDIMRCKPGAVICDVALPADIKASEAALRPDVLVIESGGVLIPGEIDIGYDIGLPPKIVYACLAETALLAMEGRFEDFTIGRQISLEKVEEIYALFSKHNFQLAGLWSFGKEVSSSSVGVK